jgi:phosphoglycolate phosphatase-like HAD superfamily hydrolase
MSNAASRLRAIIVLIGSLGTAPVLSFYNLPTMVSTRSAARSCFSISVPGKESAHVRNMYQHIKGVIFDVDGTLADSWKLGYDATVVVLDKHNLDPITEQIYHEHTIYCTPERLARHAGLVPGDADFEPVGQTLGQEFDDLYVGLVSTQTAGFYPGISEMLASIPSDVVFGALTNAAVAYAHAVLRVNDDDDRSSSLTRRFRSIHGADSVPKPKPSPDGLLVVCKDLNLKPEECVYIGDSPSDGKAAAAAGMVAIGVLWGSHKEDTLLQAPFNHYCRTVEELQSLLPKMSVNAARTLVNGEG